MFCDVGGAAYGSSIPPAAPRFASPLLMSVVVSDWEASSFRHVFGSHASGAELPLFDGLHVLLGNAPLVFYSMLRLSGHSA
jgi:hypothetical protein